MDRSIDSPGEFINTDVFGTFVLLEAARDAGIRHLQVSTDEVYGDLDEGTATEDSPLEPSSPYAASKAGGDLLVSAFARTYGADALIIRASNNYGPRQHPEKLIPLCVLNALAGDPLPVYGDGMQVRNWLYVEDCCAAIDAVLERGEPGQVYNVGGPDELPNIEVGEADPRADRARRVADRVRHRPPGPRPPLLALLGPARRARLGGAGPLRARESSGRSTGTARTSGGGSRSARASTATYYETPLREEAVVSFRRLPTGDRRPGLIEPDVHGDERGFLVETFRKQELAELGIDVDFVQDNHSRSRGPVLRGIHLQNGPGEAGAAARAAASGTSRSTCARTRPPTSSGRAHELDGETHRQLFVPAGFGHGFCLLTDEADVLYRLSAYYDPELEIGVAWDDPRSAIEWPIDDPMLSERDRSARSLAESRSLA